MLIARQTISDNWNPKFDLLVGSRSSRKHGPQLGTGPAKGGPFSTRMASWDLPPGANESPSCGLSIAPSGKSQFAIPVAQQRFLLKTRTWDRKRKLPLRSGTISNLDLPLGAIESPQLGLSFAPSGKSQLAILVEKWPLSQIGALSQLRGRAGFLSTCEPNLPPYVPPDSMIVRTVT